MDLQTLAEHDEIVVIVGFFDLMGFTKWAEDRPPRDVLEFASALFNRTGQVIADAGGVLIKAIGDAGLFVFPADDPDKAVLALRETIRVCGNCEREYSAEDLAQTNISAITSRAARRWKC